jgi:hypothetical protein
MKIVKRIGIALIALVVLGIALFVTALILIQTDWFRDKVRNRIVAEVEKSSGGRVEIGGFKLHNLTAELSTFVVHGLKIVSILKQQVDIASLTVEKPEIHIYLQADGSTNLPTPKAARGDIAGNILALRIGHFTMSNGFAEYNSKHMPLDLRADNLAADVRYLSSPARYVAELTSHQFHVTSREVRDAAFDLETKFTIEKNRVQIHSANLTLNRSTVQFTGSVTDFSLLRADLDVKSRLHLADFAKSIKLRRHGLRRQSVGGFRSVPLHDRGPAEWPRPGFNRKGSEASKVFYRFKARGESRGHQPAERRCCSLQWPFPRQHRCFR